MNGILKTLGLGALGLSFTLGAAISMDKFKDTGLETFKELTIKDLKKKSSDDITVDAVDVVIEEGKDQ